MVICNENLIMQCSDFVNDSLKTVNGLHDIKNSGVIGAQINYTLQDAISNLVLNEISKSSYLIMQNGLEYSQMETFKITILTNKEKKMDCHGINNMLNGC
jgi:hypothetical protein